MREEMMIEKLPLKKKMIQLYYENRVGEGGSLEKVGQVDFFSIVTYFPIAKVALFQI